MPNGSRQAGFSYLLLMAWLSVLAIVMLKSHDHIHARWRQEQEAQLLFAGEQIRQAINSYRKAGDGHSCFPVSFEQLLVDRRGGKTRYHLRRLYEDPLTHQRKWGMIYDPQGRWRGVYSLSSGKPLKKSHFTAEQNGFSAASNYKQWRFTVKEDVAAPLPTQCRSGR